LVQWFYSEQAEQALEILRTSEPELFDVVTHDVEMLHVVNLQLVDVTDEIGTLQYLIGPTGRVSYWVGLLDADSALIEFIVVD
jgi:hypothetical protein